MKKYTSMEHLIRNRMNEDITTTIGKGVAKAGSKLVPGVGTAIGVADTAARAASGDTTGAAISGIGAAASVVPGVGGAIAAGADLLNLGRDLTGLSKPSTPTPTTTTSPNSSIPSSYSSAMPKTSAVKLTGGKTSSTTVVKPLPTNLKPKFAKLKEDKVSEEAEGTTERKKVENVGRPDSKCSRLSKLGQIKTKIIDEGFLMEAFKKALKEKRPKEMTQVETKPKLDVYKENDSDPNGVYGTST